MFKAIRVEPKEVFNELMHFSIAIKLPIAFNYSILWILIFLFFVKKNTSLWTMGGVAFVPSVKSEEKWDCSPVLTIALGYTIYIYP